MVVCSTRVYGGRPSLAGVSWPPWPRHPGSSCSPPGDSPDKVSPAPPSTPRPGGRWAPGDGGGGHPGEGHPPRRPLLLPPRPLPPSIRPLEHIHHTGYQGALAKQALLYHTKPEPTILNHAMPYHNIPCHTIKNHAMLYHNIPCHAILSELANVQVSTWQPSSDVQFSMDADDFGLLKHLNIDATISMSLLAGFLKVSGSGSYLTKSTVNLF